jgi:hypothetical protein
MPSAPRMGIDSSVSQVSHITQFSLDPKKFSMRPFLSMPQRYVTTKNKYEIECKAMLVSYQAPSIPERGTLHAKIRTTLSQSYVIPCDLYQ